MSSAAPQIRNQSYELVPVEALTQHPDNPNQGDVGAIVGSMEANGIYGALVVQAPRGNRKRGRILAGNHRWLAAKAAGVSEVPVVWVDVDDERATRIMLADNQTANLASYDDGALAALLVELAATAEGLTGTAFDADDLDDLLAKLEDEPGGPQPGDDDLPDRPAAKTVPGDVWLLGPHRLMCGDASDVSALDTLIGGVTVDCVLTDPPYGMNLDADYSKLPGGNSKSGMFKTPTKYRQVLGDDEPFDASFLRTYFSATREQFWFGADYYRSTLSQDDRDGSWLIWDKRKEDGSQDDVIGSTFETCWSSSPHQRRILRHYWCGAFGSPEARQRFHPTQKPIALLVDILNRWTEPGAVVADLFGGSGSTLMACHRSGRTARVMELDPLYVDVICRRYQDMTSDLPVAESSGREHDFSEATDATDRPAPEADGT